MVSMTNITLAWEYADKHTARKGGKQAGDLTVFVCVGGGTTRLIM